MNVIKICKECGIKEDCIIVKTYRYKSAIINTAMNSENRKWNGNFCPECNLIRIRKKFGYTKREDSKREIIRKAVESEKLVRDFISEKFGVSARIGHGTGPDVIFNTGNIKWSVEVKVANKNGERWRVNGVRPSRRNDDLIAIVLPNKRVHIEPMSDHLAQCVKSDGSRSIRHLILSF